MRKSKLDIFKGNIWTPGSSLGGYKKHWYRTRKGIYLEKPLLWVCINPPPFPGRSINWGSAPSVQAQREVAGELGARWTGSASGEVFWCCGWVGSSCDRATPTAKFVGAIVHASHGPDVAHAGEESQPGTVGPLSKWHSQQRDCQVNFSGWVGVADRTHHS